MTKPNEFRPLMEHLVTAWERMSDRERAKTVRVHRGCETTLKTWRRQPPAVIATDLHTEVDARMAQLMTQPRADEVKCRKGCSACCHINVTISEPEAVLLHAAAKKQGVELNYDRLRRQAAAGDDAYQWLALPREDQACEFLGEEGECRVYEDRPIACRKHLVISDPESCSTQRHPGAPVLNFVSVDAEIVASAACNVFDHGSMPAMLLKHPPKEEACQTPPQAPATTTKSPT